MTFIVFGDISFMYINIPPHAIPYPSWRSEPNASASEVAKSILDSFYSTDSLLAA